MLRVVYEATTNLPPGEIVEIRETRARVDIALHQDSRARDFATPLNAALKHFVNQCGWFQIWRGRIISPNSPDSPLTVQYEPDPQVDRLACVQIRESCGSVRLHVCPDAPAPEFVRAINPSIERFLAGGQWFQLWDGEIVTMDSDDRVMA